MINDMARTVFLSLGRFLNTQNSEQKLELQWFMEHYGRNYRQEHGGELLIESQPGSGTCVTVNLPI